MTQKELKAVYRDLLADAWGANNTGMIDYCMKKTGYLVHLSDGSIIPLEKPTIQKEFCFGYSLCAYDTEDYDLANEAAHHAAQSQRYFLHENLDQVDKILYNLESNEWNSWDYFICVKYCSQSSDNPLRGLNTFYLNTSDAHRYRRLQGDDRQRVIDGYKVIRIDFEKRLLSYLKRYGLSKVRTWSYWQDE